MIRRRKILYAIALLLMVAWFVVCTYWRDDITDRIESLFGAGRIPHFLADSFIFLPLYILFVSAVSTWHRNWRRKFRQAFGRCEECGYDLRASKDRCPECGTEFGSSEY